MTLDSFVGLIRALYAGEQPKPLDALCALHDARSAGAGTAALRPALRKRVDALANCADPIGTAFGVDLAALSARQAQRARKGEITVGQLVLGAIAEDAFEAIWRSRLGASEFALDDNRASRNDTDYRVLNGGGRPLFRVNIKFHGSVFRQARELVGLDPQDCFPLATYKVWSAMQKERDEHLPYLFLVISTPISAASVAERLPADIGDVVRLVHACDRMTGKRSLEERVVAHLLWDASGFAPTVAGWREQLARTRWRVLSAQRAVRLLRDKLFERVFAVRIRNFAQAWRNAELDMHFSLSEDMTPLEDVLDVLAREGSQGVVGRCMTGII